MIAIECIYQCCQGLDQGKGPDSCMAVKLATESSSPCSSWPRLAPECGSPHSS